MKQTDTVPSFVELCLEALAEVCETLGTQAAAAQRLPEAPDELASGSSTFRLPTGRLRAR